MPRAIWSGSISFGLVNIPIKLYAAVSRKTVHFNQLDSRTGARVKHKKVSAADGEEVPAEAIVKGYELASGDYVTVGDDELGALDPEASRAIDSEEFETLDESDASF
jgi:DNA end-binding protein Ku